MDEGDIFPWWVLDPELCHSIYQVEHLKQNTMSFGDFYWLLFSFICKPWFFWVQAYFSTKNIHPSSHLLLSSKSMMNVLDRILSLPLDCTQVYPGCTGCGLVANVFKLAALFCLPSVPRFLIWGVQPRDSEEIDSIHRYTLTSRLLVSCYY